MVAMMGTTSCKLCCARGEAHYPWCLLVGGDGIGAGGDIVPRVTGSRHAHSAHAEQVRALMRLARRPRRPAVTPPEPELELPRTNNGWISLAPPVDYTPPQIAAPAAGPVEFTPPERGEALPVAKARRPGREIGDRRIRRAVNRAIDQGWEYRPFNERHRGKPRLLAPDGATYTLPSTPSDHRAADNTIAWLRQHGAAV